MFNSTQRSSLVCLFFLAVFFLHFAKSHAVVAVLTEVVSGIILQKYDNHAVKLDNGKIYYPSRDGLVINLQVGDPVTLKYVAGDSDKNVFFEFAPGLNSLTNKEPEAGRKDNSPK